VLRSQRFIAVGIGVCVRAEQIQFSSHPASAAVAAAGSAAAEVGLEQQRRGSNSRQLVERCCGLFAKLYTEKWFKI